MKALIFAAGLGTRLKPLTDMIPKAMVPIDGRPLLAHVIEKLKDAGSKEIIINVHHFPDQIIEYVRSQHSFDIRIEFSDERDNLLDTGAGIRKAAHFFDDGQAFLVHNVDILSNLKIKELYEYHLKSHALATLAVGDRKTSRYLLFDNELYLKAWINEQTGALRPTDFKQPELYRKLAFSGIQVLSAEVFKWMKNFEERFSIMDFYLSMAHLQPIQGFIPDDFQMIDVGKLDVLDEAEKFVRSL